MCYALNDSQGSVEQCDIQPVLLHKTDFACSYYDHCMMHHVDDASSTTSEEADITRPMADMVQNWHGSQTLWQGRRKHRVPLSSVTPEWTYYTLVYEHWPLYCCSLLN